MTLNTHDRIAGVLVPLFALRGQTDLGIGDTAAAREMIDWCVAHGFRLFQMLPINETGPDNSPYNAISALALDPTTIATTPQSLPGLAEDDFQRLTRGMETNGPVRYREVKSRKLKLLQAAFARRGATDRKADNAFAKANPWLRDYTLFRALIDEHDGRDNWEEWPVEHQSPTEARRWLKQQSKIARTTFDELQQFYAYIQRVAHEQWAAVRQYADERGVALMGDIPFGVSRYSADVWANRNLFELDWSGGAPPEANFQPDEFTAKWGQNWGIPLYRWPAHRRQRFAWWKLRVRQTSRIFHSFRIDHVLGFYRVYAFPWRPADNDRFTKLDETAAAKLTGGRLPRFFPQPDDTQSHRQANCRQGAGFLKMILQAAGPTVVVAEDLGMVPEYVRPNLTKLGIPGFKIPHWERNEDYSYVAPEEYPRLSLVTPATHDHEPLAARWRQMWQAHEDCRARQDHHGAYVTWLELQRFVRWTGEDENRVPHEFTSSLHEAYARQALNAESWLALFMITDVLGSEQRFNVPGPVAESNWTERLAHPVHEIDGDQAARFARLIRESGRAG